MVLAPAETFDRRAESTGLVTLGCMTDNQGNSFLLDKLMTTKYPLGIILIELAWQCAQRRVALRADWVPRLQNEEADDLTNWEFSKFDQKLRVNVDLETIEFGVLRELLATGEDYFTQLEEARAEAKTARTAGTGAGAGTSGGGKRQRRRLGALRETDPWK